MKQQQPSIPFLQPNGIVWVCTKYEANKAWLIAQLAQPLNPLLSGLLADGASIKLLASDPTARKRTIDAAIGNVWTALRENLSSLKQTLSPDSPAPLSPEAHAHVQFVSAVEDKLLSPNLDFLRYSYKDQWIETEKRLQRLDAPLSDTPLSDTAPQTLRGALESLGLKLSLQQLEALHALYGQSIGATTSTNNALTDRVTAWNNDLNHFFNGLYFHHNPLKDPASLPLIDALLAPIQEAKKQP